MILRFMGRVEVRRRGRIERGGAVVSVVIVAVFFFLILGMDD